jgi:hypothetical protein
MRLYLQFGHGMMGHTRALLASWESGGVILSPRDLTGSQIVKMAADLRKMECEALIDPQCFAHDGDHHRLIAHEYFRKYRDNPSESFQGGIGTATLLESLAKFAKSSGVIKHILPAPLANPVNDDWFAFQENVIDEAPSHFGNDPLLATIALANQPMLDDAQVESVIERASRWNVHGFYLIAESDSAYLVENPIWLANVLILASGLKLLGKEVIVGYANHQLLPLGATKVDIIASGTWLNVRAFPIEKFYMPDEDDTSRRATWYYCPQALSEYKLPFLDVAKRMGVLNDMRPDEKFDCSYSDIIFAGATPSSINWGEQNAFRHYLSCLNLQVARGVKQTFDKTLDDYRAQLDSAEALLAQLRSKGVFGQDREFHRVLETNRSALILFQEARGERLRCSWDH